MLPLESEAPFSEFKPHEFKGELSSFAHFHCD